ncbi:hypothetical protein NDU88_010067 [Pleurodeles waltl]|uniref:Uncharacterized protein n=1 Tax=Pleurodeles waltl TaxID=8319 RepID=A0AAV7QWF1_PLEWA|nr:hypothetical protein NDU88_010067 [Pleurodeles waltl]
MGFQYESVKLVSMRIVKMRSCQTERTVSAKGGEHHQQHHQKPQCPEPCPPEPCQEPCRPIQQCQDHLVQQYQDHTPKCPEQGLVLANFENEPML